MGYHGDLDFSLYIVVKVHCKLHVAEREDRMPKRWSKEEGAAAADRLSRSHRHIQDMIIFGNCAPERVELLLEALDAFMTGNLEGIMTSDERIMLVRETVVNVITAVKPKKALEGDIVDEALLEIPLREIKSECLKPQVRHALMTPGLTHIGQLVQLEDRHLVRIRNIGKSRLTEIELFLSQIGLSLNMSLRDDLKNKYPLPKKMCLG